MLKLFVLIKLLLVTQIATSQYPELHWAGAFHAKYNYTDNGIGGTIAVDQLGNVYSAGIFQHTVDFDPGFGEYTLTAGGAHESAVYLSKLDAAGNFIWAKQFPVSGGSLNVQIKVDRDGFLFVAFDLNHMADVDPGSGVYLMTPIGAVDAVLAKLTPDGDLIWAKQFGGPGDTVPSMGALDINEDGSIIVSGSFNNTVDFDPGLNTFNLTSTAHMQSFIVKLNNVGALVWAKQFGNGTVPHHTSAISDLKVDREGYIYLTGGFNGTVDFDPSGSVYNVTSSSISDGFISKLQPDGSLVWVKRMGNIGSQYNYHIEARTVAIDSFGNIITTGSFIGTFDFDPGPAVLSFTSYPYDAYVLKVNASGELIWAKAFGGDESDFGNDVVVDNQNNIYVSGLFGTSVDFNPGPEEYIINSPHYGASVVLKLNEAAGFIYAAPFQSLDYGSTMFRSMKLDLENNIFITGSVMGTVDFDPGPDVFPLSGTSNSSPFVLKLAPCKNQTYSYLEISTCDQYVLNNVTYQSTGQYKQTIPNSFGCDSIITLNLIINKKIIEQSKSVCDGIAFFAGGIDQYKSGTYRDTLKTIEGCDSIVITHLLVTPKPLPNLGPDKNICSNTELILSPGLFTKYTWHDMSADVSVIVKNPGKYWVTVTNDYNCSNTDTINILSVIPSPSNYLLEKDSICSYQDLKITPSRQYVNYTWSTGSKEKNLTIKTPGKYTLMVEDRFGCIGHDSINVYPKKCIYGFYIPTAFTPNNDGKNDIFKPLIYGRLTKYQFVVYNRWGQQVFNTSDIDKGWDGNLKGLQQNTDVFIWICTFQLEGDEPQTKKGSFTLLR